MEDMAASPVSPRAQVLGRDALQEAQVLGRDALQEALPCDSSKPSENHLLPMLQPRRFTLARVAARLGMILGLGALILVFVYPRLRHGPLGEEKCDGKTYGTYGLSAFMALASWALAWVALVAVYRGNPKGLCFIRFLRFWLVLGFAVNFLKFSYHQCLRCETDSSLRLRMLCVELGTFHYVVWICWTVGTTALIMVRVAALESAQGAGAWSRRIARYVLWPSMAGLACMVTALFVLMSKAEHAKHQAIVFILAALLLVLGQVAGIAMALRAWGPALSQAKAFTSSSAGRLKDARLGLLSTVRWHLRFLVLCGATAVVFIVFLVTEAVMTLRIEEAGDVWEQYVLSCRTTWLYHLGECAELVNLITNEMTILIISDLLGIWPPRCALWTGCRPAKRQSAAAPGQGAAPGWETGNAEWDRKVLELSRRGVTVEKLLDFYSTLGQTRMAHFDAAVHRTAHVVRQAIVPASAYSRFGPCALATILMEGESTPSQRMVTHCWDALFVDLVSVVVADALGLRSYEGLAAWLVPQRIGTLRQHLSRAGTLKRSYWICALSVNQHSCICAGGRVDLDPVLGRPEPRCSCGHPKWWNDSPPLDAKGESCLCEVNKFDDMMTLLAQEDPCFAQVIVVDRSRLIFQRAWCMAEIFAANACAMDQVVVALSHDHIEAHHMELANLRVEDMRASREEDKQMILGKIGDPMKFNEAVRDLATDKDFGLMAGRCDAICSAQTVGHLAKRSG